MIRHKKLSLFFVLFLSTHSYALREKALCAVPIADCSVHCLSMLYEHQDCTTTYTTMPLSGKSGIHPCARDQQLLLHEEVTIVDDLGDEVQIEVPHLVYIDPDFPTHYKNSFWTLKKNLITYKELEERNSNYRRCLPHPITTDSNKSLEYNSSIVALKLPFHDPTTNQTYSAGTRFLLAYQTPLRMIVWVFDAHDKQFKQTVLDQALCYTYEPRTAQERIQDFVALLKLWANNPDGVIPFVWGGSSFCTVCTQEKFATETETQPYQIISYWKRPECTTQPYAGFDATGLVLRAAQIVGLPYYYKNTPTVRYCLPPLSIDEPLQNGDILWIAGGGTIVISDIQNNTVIAARGYQTGFGCVVESPLSILFKNMTTIDELQQAYKNKTALECCTKDGTLSKLSDDWCIIRLPN